MQLKKIFFIYILFFIIIITVLSNLYLKRNKNSCLEMPQQHIQTKVVTDLYKKIPKWKDLSAESLGTTQPEIKFVPSGISASENVHVLGVDIIGKIKQVKLFATYDCKTNRIEYSSREMIFP